jgi:quinohemoprotein amine dehydrogenase
MAGHTQRFRFRSIALGSCFLVSLSCFAFPAGAQETASTPEVKVTTPSKDPAEAGFPVSDPLTLSKCGTCHAADAKGNMSRISYIRTTPEGWEEAIKRMVRLNGLQLSPEDARSILRYLSDYHGLAPEEASKVAYFTEHRIVDEKIDNPDVAHGCGSCHALAKPLSWHRTMQDWKYLKDMHLAFFPAAQFTAFDRAGGRRGAEGAEGAPKGPAPAEAALEYIVKSSPLHSAEWSAWQGSVQTPNIAGRWLVSGTQPGKGRFFGEMVITPAAGGTFTTKSKLTCEDGSSPMTGSGASLIYTGYAWRGKSTIASGEMGPDAPKTIREVMMLSKDQSEFKGRWFWGEYQEFGMDVTMRRATGGPIVSGVDVAALKAGSSDTTMRIYGDNLPANLTASDVDLGSGVKVTKIVSQDPGMVTVSATVDAKATPGTRTISVKGAAVPNAYAVYDKMDFLKVTPVTSLAHLGSSSHPKGYAQFETVAYSNGPDGKPNTADDIELGPVPATYKLEEFVASYGDDDTHFVGSVDSKTGLFVPASDGPDPKRKSMRNNYGDVWVTGTYLPPGSTVPLVGRSYLIVAVPTYQNWDQPEVGQ